jgi:hypothetical protein
MSEQLISLQDVPESVRKTIDDNHTVYTASRGTGIGGYFWLPWIVIMVIKGAWGGCGDTSDNYDYFKNGDFKVYQMDSMVKMLKDSSRKPNLDTMVLENLDGKVLR